MGWRLGQANISWYHGVVDEVAERFPDILFNLTGQIVPLIEHLKGHDPCRSSGFGCGIQNKKYSENQELGVNCMVMRVYFPRGYRLLYLQFYHLQF